MSGRGKTLLSWREHFYAKEAEKECRRKGKENQAILVSLFLFCVYYFKYENMHIGFIQQSDKLGISRGKSGHRTTSHSEPVRLSGVGISIEFQAAYRHPFVGAVIDRPQKSTFSPKEIRIGHLPLPGAQ